MPFAISNALNTLLHLMTKVPRPFIGEFVVKYFDDILVYTKMKHLMSNISLNCSKQGGNKYYMINLRSVSSLLPNFYLP